MQVVRDADNQNPSTNLFSKNSSESELGRINDSAKIVYLQRNKGHLGLGKWFTSTDPTVPGVFQPYSKPIAQKIRNDNEDTNSYVSDGYRNSGRPKPVQNTVLLPEISENALTESV